VLKNYLKVFHAVKPEIFCVTSRGPDPEVGCQRYETAYMKLGQILNILKILSIAFKLTFLPKLCYTMQN